MADSMNKGLSKLQKTVLVGILCILTAGIVIWQLLEHSKIQSDTGAAGVVTADTDDWELELEEDNKGGVTEGILIPGYGAVSMQTGAEELPISLGNPQENNCYFKITVTLLDGAVLYESDYIKPGQGMEGIPIKKKMAPGTYEVLLNYRCFSMDEELTELNGAESSFSLTVK